MIILNLIVRTNPGFRYGSYGRRKSGMGKGHNVLSPTRMFPYILKSYGSCLEYCYPQALIKGGN
jgi:hypothetical protein